MLEERRASSGSWDIRLNRPDESFYARLSSRLIFRSLRFDSRARLFSIFRKVVEEINRKREHDGTVLLRADGVQRLQVSQLNGRRRLCNDLE